MYCVCIVLALLLIPWLYSLVIFEAELGLVTDVVPQTYLHDNNNFMISTLICAQLAIGELVYPILVLYRLDT